MICMDLNIYAKDKCIQKTKTKIVSGVVKRRPVPRRGFRGECCPRTVLHRLCRQRNDKLSLLVDAGSDSSVYFGRRKHR